ncbi:MULTISPECIES: hypothetical protein [Burkholderia]|uniref:Uncharacterized protein n=1 Tax=Burkholderia pyrrocinia TaxID=60550 RepID=A0A318J3A2_BURPY|nr:MULTISPECIES: hypothetical protein [Burkholderia]PXX41131.1 hypothetical protein NA66_1001741 [Burkholderia pyrrocinia]SFW58559.1 hypothetical protein SAMN03159384_03056 [Burkholderia sp. NFACC33-1]SFY12129.1 hypothetical protein SAMN03159408_03268 [Burkholderia sp. NFPP32]
MTNPENSISHDLLFSAACECLSPDQMDKFESLFVGDADTCARFLRCIFKRAPHPPSADAAAAPAVAKREDWQQKALDHGFTYWRAPDAHGVECTTSQAVNFLQDVLGVEVEIENAVPKDERAALAAALEAGRYTHASSNTEKHRAFKDGWNQAMTFSRAAFRQARAAASRPAAAALADVHLDAPLSLIPHLVAQDEQAVSMALLNMSDAICAWRIEAGKYREISSYDQSAFSDGYEAGMAAMLSARAAASQPAAAAGQEATAIPAGYVLVPKVITQPMMRASGIGSHSWGCALEAAPPAQEKDND